MKNLKLRQRQKFALIGAFSLGLITMAISFGRFMVYTVSDFEFSDKQGGTTYSSYSHSHSRQY
jgi:hypothetical protein